MSTYVSRRYAGPRDLDDLITFAQDATAARAPKPAYYHPGDFVWQLFAFDETDDARIWSASDGRDVACAIFEPPSWYEFAVHPDVERDPELVHEITRWADGRRAVADNKDDVPLAYPERGTNTISTSAFASDRRRIDALLADGYARADEQSFRNARRLDDSLPDVVLPAGAEFCAITGQDEDERADLHRDAWSVWGTSAFTLERYRRLRASPLYDAELDVVLSVGGRMASYCICWLDERNRIGLFEPVGTRPQFTRRGLGKLVLLEAFRRLRDRGMRTAIVGTSTVNQPAMALYRSAGFAPVEEVHTYVKADAS
jgi:GNAT superfamily N-acetyltransferase